MISTIVRTKTDKYYGKSTGQRIVKIFDTVLATVKHYGEGQITINLILWAVNSQLSTEEQLTEAQVRSALNRLSREWYRFSSNGHGVYRLAAK